MDTALFAALRKHKLERFESALLSDDVRSFADLSAFQTDGGRMRAVGIGGKALLEKRLRALLEESQRPQVRVISKGQYTAQHGQGKAAGSAPVTAAIASAKTAHGARPVVRLVTVSPVEAGWRNWRAGDRKGAFMRWAEGRADAVALGMLKLHGEGGEAKDEAGGVALLEEAAVRDPRSPCVTVLAQCYLEGRGVAQSGARALKLLEGLVSSGDPAAKRLMGRAYWEGVGVDQDDAKALKWCREAAAADDAEAQLALSVMFGTGRGVAANPAVAAEWATRAANKGLPAAQYALAMCYGNGIGVQANEARAVDLLRRAAAQNHAEACFALAVCHRRGLGAARNEKEARRLLARAKELGSTSAARA